MLFTAFSALVYKSWPCLCCWRWVSSNVFFSDILSFYVYQCFSNILRTAIL